MAADTAYLKGGPCHGTTRKITTAESDTGEIVCKGALYVNQGEHRHGDIVFNYVGKAPSAAPPPKLKAPQALRGWRDMQRSVNTHLPAALHTSKRAHRAALRELRRASKVRL